MASICHFLFNSEASTLTLCKVSHAVLAFLKGSFKENKLWPTFFTML